MMNIEEIFQKLDGLFAQNAITEVEPFLLSCLAQAKEENAYGVYLSVGNELIGFYRSVSLFEKAFAISEDVLLLLEELNLEETEHFATTLLNVATAYRAAGRLEEAKGFYTRALQLYERLLAPGDYRFAGLYNNLSLLLEQQGENEKAALFLENAIDIIEKIEGCRTELATSKTNLALICFKLSQDERAMTLLEEAISIYKEDQDNTSAHYSAALAGMGEALFRQGRFLEALEAYETSLTEVEKHFGKNASYALLCDNCASVCAKLGLMEKQKAFEQTAGEVRDSLQISDRREA